MLVKAKHLRRHRGLRLLLLPLGLQFSLKNELPNYLHFKRSKVRQQSLASGHLAPAACSGLWKLMQLHPYRCKLFLHASIWSREALDQTKKCSIQKISYK